MSLLFNGENIKKFRKWLQLLSLSVSQSSPDAYPFLSRRGTIISKPKVNWLLQEKTIKNLGADTPSRKRTNVRYNLTQLTNVNPHSMRDNKRTILKK